MLPPMDDHVGDAGLLVIQTCAEDKTAISLVLLLSTICCFSSYSENLGRTLDVTTPMYKDLVCYRHLCRGASIGVSIVRLGGLRTPCHVPRGMCLAAPFVGLFLSWRI